MNTNEMKFIKDIAESVLPKELLSDEEHIILLFGQVLINEYRKSNTTFNINNKSTWPITNTEVIVCTKDLDTMTSMFTILKDGKPHFDSVDLNFVRNWEPLPDYLN